MMKWICLLACGAAFGQVPYERIVAAEKEPGNWLTYSGNYAGHRYSPLSQITPGERSRTAREMGVPISNRQQPRSRPWWPTA